MAWKEAKRGGETTDVYQYGLATRPVAGAGRAGGARRVD